MSENNDKSQAKTGQINDQTVIASAQEAMKNRPVAMQRRQFILWMLALVVGGILGSIGCAALNELFNYVATIFTRLFQLIAVPTISLAVITTLASLGAQRRTGRIFTKALTYTLFTTFLAAAVGLGLYLLIAPGNLPAEVIGAGQSSVPQNLGSVSYAQHIVNTIPNNAVQPFLSGNVLSVLLMVAAAGIALAFMPESENRATLVKGLLGLQEMLFTLIRGLVFILPVGVLAFAGQLAAQIEAGVALGVLGQYTAVIMLANAVQMFVVLPLLLMARGLNPVTVFKKMSPALAVALFTKSSAATLPVTMNAAEHNLGVRPHVARFVLPICTTINMNGCAAFILVTSLFVMQNAGLELTAGLMAAWVFVAIFAAVGNAGVPMGCYFLTLSLMGGMGVPLGLMGVILPIYTVIDMIETAENVWSDSCVCAITDKEAGGEA